MGKHLYFVCPTDNLETIIESHFQNKNYFFSSLGNSLGFSFEVVEEINSLIENKAITEINFVLADNNKLISGGINDERFDELSSLENFYDIIQTQKKQTEAVWNKIDSRIPIISYYLNLKIQELNNQLIDVFDKNITINGKIYKTNANSFNEIHADLLHLDKFILN